MQGEKRKRKGIKESRKTDRDRRQGEETKRKGNKERRVNEGCFPFM